MTGERLLCIFLKIAGCVLTSSNYHLTIVLSREGGGGGGGGVCVCVRPPNYVHVTFHALTFSYMCCCWNMSECLLSSLWSCSGRTPTLVKRLLSTFSSSIRSSILFWSLSFSLTSNLTFSSVSRDLSFAFSLLFRTAMLFLSRRLRYSSLALSTDLWFFLLLLLLLLLALLLLLLLWWWFSIAVFAAKFLIPETNKTVWSSNVCFVRGRTGRGEGEGRVVKMNEITKKVWRPVKGATTFVRYTNRLRRNQADSWHACLKFTGSEIVVTRRGTRNTQTPCPNLSSEVLVRS